jgi:hypothetical protein
MALDNRKLLGNISEMLRLSDCIIRQKVSTGSGQNTKKSNLSANLQKYFLFITLEFLMRSIATGNNGQSPCPVPFLIKNK